MGWVSGMRSIVGGDIVLTHSVRQLIKLTPCNVQLLDCTCCIALSQLQAQGQQLPMF